MGKYQMKQYQSPNISKRIDTNGKTWQPDVFVFHIAEGWYDGTIAWEMNKASGISSTFIIAKDGRIAQMVPLNMAPHTQGLNLRSTPMPTQSKKSIVRERKINPNPYCISVEFEGFYDDFYDKGKLKEKGCKGAITDAQVEAAVQVICYCQAELPKFGYKPLILDREHFIGHCEISPFTRPHCPGGLFPYNRILEGVKAASVTDEPKAWYRIRKAWNLPDTQKNAFLDKDLAIKECKKYSGYSVYNENGQTVFPEKSKPTALELLQATGIIDKSFKGTETVTVNELAGVIAKLLENVKG